MDGLSRESVRFFVRGVAHALSPPPYLDRRRRGRDVDRLVWGGGHLAEGNLDLLCGGEREREERESEDEDERKGGTGLETHSRSPPLSLPSCLFRGRRRRRRGRRRRHGAHGGGAAAEAGPGAAQGGGEGAHGGGKFRVKREIDWGERARTFASSSVLSSSPSAPSPPHLRQHSHSPTATRDPAAARPTPTPR